MIAGMEETLKNLNTEISGVKGRTMAGLFAGGLIIQRTSQKRVPVEYGNMRASAYTRRSQVMDGTVEIGYTAAYALFVHENMEQKLKGLPRPSGLGEYWGPDGQPKFLESALYDERDRVVAAVASYAEIR